VSRVVRQGWVAVACADGAGCGVAVDVAGAGSVEGTLPVGAGVGRPVWSSAGDLSADSARGYHDSAIYDDPVEVTGSSVPLSAADGDIYDWAIPWSNG